MSMKCDVFAPLADSWICEMGNTLHADQRALAAADVSLLESG